MDVLEFAELVRDRSDDFQLDEWALRVNEVVAERALYLAQYFEAIPDDLKETYSSFVVDVISRLPEDSVIEVSPYLYTRLTKLLPDEKARSFLKVLNGS